MPQADARQALVESVKEVGVAGAQGFGEEAAPGVGRERGGPGTEVAVGAPAEVETVLWMGRGQAEQDFPGVEADSGELFTGAVGGVEGDSQSIRYAFILR
jgi:hypothetical protein